MFHMIWANFVSWFNGKEIESLLWDIYMGVQEDSVKKNSKSRVKYLLESEDFDPRPSRIASWSLLRPT